MSGKAGLARVISVEVIKGWVSLDCKEVGCDGWVRMYLINTGQVREGQVWLGRNWIDQAVMAGVGAPRKRVMMARSYWS